MRPQPAEPTDEEKAEIERLRTRNDELANMIERFQSKADGEIRPRGRNGSSKKGRGKASREIVSLSTVQRMRPERDEIIICTGVNRTTLGVQYWGDRAVGLFVDAKYR